MPDIEPLATPKPEPFACPNCGARYTLVRARQMGRRCLASLCAVVVAVRSMAARAGSSSSISS